MWKFGRTAGSGSRFPVQKAALRESSWLQIPFHAPFFIVHSLKSLAWFGSLISSSVDQSLKCFDYSRNFVCSALISLCLNDPAYRFVFVQASNDQRQSRALRRFDRPSLNQIAAAIRKLQGLFERELGNVARICVPMRIGREIPGNILNQL